MGVMGINDSGCTHLIYTINYTKFLNEKESKIYYWVSIRAFTHCTLFLFLARHIYRWVGGTSR
jgi:hypothetical protein